MAGKSKPASVEVPDGTHTHTMKRMRSPRLVIIVKIIKLIKIKMSFVTKTATLVPNVLVTKSEIIRISVYFLKQR